MKTFINLCSCCLTSGVPLTDGFIGDNNRSYEKVTDILNETFSNVKVEKDSCYKLCENCCELLQCARLFRKLFLTNQTIYQGYLKQFHLEAELNFEQVEYYGLCINVDKGNDSLLKEHRSVSNDYYQSDDENIQEGNEAAANDNSDNGYTEDDDDYQPGDTLWHYNYNKNVKKKKRKMVSEDMLIKNKKDFKETSNKRDMVSVDMLIKKYKLKTEIGFRCPDCDKLFKRKIYLKTHQSKVHSDLPKQKPYKCSYCIRRFISSYLLQEHELIHTDARPYKCQMCDATFRIRYNLTIHTRSHTNEKPYKCRYCEKEFIAGNSRRSHERIHTNSRPYKCKLCDATFRQTGSLSTHMRTHTKERPYTCKHCSFSFTTSSARNRHEKNMHRKPANTTTEDNVTNNQTDSQGEDEEAETADNRPNDRVKDENEEMQEEKEKDNSIIGIEHKDSSAAAVAPLRPPEEEEEVEEEEDDDEAPFEEPEIICIKMEPNFKDPNFIVCGDDYYNGYN